MKTQLYLLLLSLFACTNEIASVKSTEIERLPFSETTAKDQHWEGAFTNGMKQTYISFDVSADGKQLKNLTFKGWW